MKKYTDANIAHWDEAASRHFETKSELYDVEAFKQGAQTLRRIELEKLGGVRGLSILHLQCHFGLDSMSLSRLGAHVTGVDFSDKSITLAQELANDLKLDTKFICSNIYDLPMKLSQQFDVVLTTYGVLVWLQDLPRWAEVVAKFMKKDAKFLLVDGHPFCDMLGHPVDGKPENEQLQVLYPYFDTAPLPVSWTSSYASSTVEGFSGSIHYEFVHTLADILSSVVNAGLRIISYEEYPLFMYKQFERLEATADGYWKQPVGEIPIPALFSLTATKP